ncbi:TonB-dependent receptor [Sandaracinobacteroides saxicola]|uniref:TonB-dependent receptor n=1 Tax=Sandaracinobacteroides saxicola TaxID=2759707 RepID=A0A7G5IJV9_9SPHN|nr:TonB-dependent receptor [Sandaracinobacteroides saxicola]QMW23651.1 TonB-dependent receptor [Sandaracinobacteroides saxicola]
MRHLTAALLASSALFTMPLFAQAPAAPAVSAAEAGDDIVVTARRRSESLISVPIAVTAISGETLAAQGAPDITSLQRQTPNLTLEVARGSNSTLIAFIRGVGQQDPLWGFEPGVGLYVDDVYIARPQGAVLDVFDVARVEVLRGPQGTLYGRNTIGGAIKYVTNRLGNELKLKAKAAYGSYNQVDLVGQVTLPLTDTLSVGGAVAWYNRDGYGRNLTTGVDQYDKDVLAARVSVEWAPSDAVFIRLAGDQTLDKSNPKHGTRLLGNAGLPAFEPTASVYDTRAGIGNDNRVKTRGASLTAEFKPGEGLTLKSITALRDGRTDTLIDFDNTAGPVLDVPAFYSDRQFTQELQLLIEGERLQGVLGAYYLNGRASGAFDTVLGLANLTILTSGTVKTKSYALFGDLSYALTDTVKLSAGLRWTKDDKVGTVFRRNYTGIRSPLFGNAAAIPGLVRTDYTNDRSDEKATPRVSLSWTPEPDLNVYASWGRGFKSGGFDMRGDAVFTPGTVNGYKPETIDSYELGVKGAFIDRTLFLNLAGFYSKYKDQQVTIQVPGAAGIASIVDNAGKANIHGFEAEARVVASKNLSANFVFGYTRAKYTEFKTFIAGGSVPVDVADQRVFQNTPKYVFNASLTWSQDVAGGTVAFTPALSYRSALSVFEIPNALLDQPGYALVDASINWTSGDGRLRLGVHGRNLTDERYRVGGYNFPGALFGNSIIGYYGPPRTVTGTIEFRY